MKKLGLLWCLFTMSCLAMLASDVSFTVQAPQSVVVGQQFRLVYTVNQEAKDLRVPEMPNFEVLMGPSVSSQRSVQIVNGSMSSSLTINHTFILMANEPGTFTIGAASIMVKKEKYTSQPVTIKVLPADQTSATNNASTSRTNEPASQSSQVSLSSKQLFVRQTLSKTTVYQQEAVLLTYKLYARVDIAQIGSAKFPEFKDFYVQEIELDPNRSWQVEHYEGLNYNTIVLKQYLLFPQRAGQLTIDQGNVEAVVRMVTNQHSGNFFGDFFNTYQDVKKELHIPAKKITVKALPAGAPAGFNGAVGQYQLQSTLSATEVNTNDAVTLKVKVSGKGNLKLAKVPEITFPADFDAYDPKTDNNIKASINGVTGSKTTEYVAIPRFGGTFQIPSAQFVYFDPADATYKTLSTQPYTITVSGNAVANNPIAGTTASSGVNKEKVKNLGSDIRFIHTGGDKELKANVSTFNGTSAHYMAYVLPLVLCALLLAILHKQAKENANVVRVKNKRANKLARKRLKSAAACIKAGNKASFYEAAIQALWGYIADKLNIPLANLTKDNVQEELMRHGASQAVIDEFLQLLSDLEFARYSPVVDDSLSMENCYEKAANLIGQLENALK